MNKKYLPQIILLSFLFLLVIITLVKGLPFVHLFNNSLIRLSMNGILVLSLVPMLRAGMGINFGLPIGLTGGLIGMLFAVNFSLTGLVGFFSAIIISIPFVLVFSYGYGKILNNCHKKEEIVTTFIGFSFVFILNFFWATAPFTNRAMLWPIGGEGLRPTISLRSTFGHSLNDFLQISIGSVVIPIGSLLFFLFCLLIMWIFFRTPIGLAMSAGGRNQSFIQRFGISYTKIRYLAVFLSTLLAAIGICTYAQSYGFIQLYDAPLMMVFPVVSALLVGGNTTEKHFLWQVFFGTYIFQSIYIFSAPVAGALFSPELAEIFRSLITNGIILFALFYDQKRGSACD